MALALLSNGHDSALVWLALGGNSITDRGAEHFAVALKLQHVSASEGLSGKIKHCFIVATSLLL